MKREISYRIGRVSCKCLSWGRDEDGICPYFSLGLSEERTGIVLGWVEGYVCWKSGGRRSYDNPV